VRHLRGIPVRVRVAAACALAMAIVLAAAGALVYARLASDLSQSLDRELRLRADDLGVLVVQDGGRLSRSGTGPFVEHGEAYAQLLDPRGRVVDATRPLRRPLLTAGQLRRATQTTLIADHAPLPGLDEPSRLLATPVASGGRRLVLVVGVTSQDRAETLASLRDELLLAAPLALVLATLVGYLLAGLALRPVEAMRRQAAAISGDRGGARLDVPATGDEVARLAATLNEMLARLERALERERALVADAGHELRTPLSLLRTELELALRHGDSVDGLREAVRAASGEAERLGRLAEDLLLIARSDGGELALRRERLEAARLLDLVLARFEWRAAEYGRALTHDAGPAVLLVGDQLRLEQALGNMVDNALRHGQGAVHLSAVARPDAVELHVEDEGDGFPASFLPHAFDRFSRPSAARSGAGAGLGLSIAATVARAHGGSAGARNRPDGGADVWIAIPLHLAEPAPPSAPRTTAPGIQV
jgi:signal transduction histidine kinase